MSFPFFAYLSRLRLIHRWSLMRNTVPENDAEHSLQVAMIAHAIAIIARDRYGKDVDPEHVLSLAVYHDATEVMTGDLPTPVKYHSDELRGAYHRLEELSADRLLALLPEDLQPAYNPYMSRLPVMSIPWSRPPTAFPPASSAWRSSVPATGNSIMPRKTSGTASLPSTCRRSRIS